MPNNEITLDVSGGGSADVTLVSWLKSERLHLFHGIQSHHFMGNRWGNSGNIG